MFDGFYNIYRINKGWSADEKYYVEDADHQKFILRVSDISCLETKKEEFEILKKNFSLGIRMSEPLRFGICEQENKVYQLLKWVEGKPAEDFLPGLSEERQYDLGVQAGEILKRMHSLTAPRSLPAWEEKINRKIKLRLAAYKKSGFMIPQEDKLINFIEINTGLLKNRPLTFQHGDFHPGNLILTPEGDITVVDFNRWSYGDPWEEFDRLTYFSRSVSIPFSIGQIDGYFGENKPHEFFPILALYTAMITLFTVAWAVSFGKLEVKNSLKRAEMILADYSGFESIHPAWLKSG